MKTPDELYDTGNPVEDVSQSGTFSDCQNHQYENTTVPNKVSNIYSTRSRGGGGGGGGGVGGGGE